MRYFLSFLFLISSGWLGAISCPPCCNYSCWSGLYLGGTFGFGWDVRSGARRTFSTSLDEAAAGGIIPTNFEVKPDGIVGGGQIGFNWQIHKWVLGIEADIQNGIKDKQRIDLQGNPPFVSSLSKATNEIDWFATVRGRIGFAISCNLLYVTAGFARGRVEDEAQFIATPETDGTFFALSNRLKSGRTVGGGIECALCRHWSIKLEYLYIDLGHNRVHLKDPTHFPGDFLDYQFSHRANLARAGFNYFF